MKLKDLEGKHVLTGVDFGKLKNKDYSYDESTTVDFILDGKIFSAIEDPNDGYRSCMSEIIENREGVDIKNIFDAIVVCGVMRNDSIYEVNEIIDFVDIENGKIVLSIGTANADDYYPYFVGDWNPENLHVNQARQHA